MGTFLTNPGAVPLVVITTITAQLGLPADTDLALYQSPDTWWDHQALIRQHYGYQDMLTLPVLIPLLRWLYSRAWTHAERPSVLFDLTTAWLVERKIVLPGVTVVARLVARVRDRVNARLWQSLAHLPTPTQHTQLGLKPSISQPNALALRFLIFAFILLMRIGIIIKSAPLFLIRMPWNSALGDRKMRNYHQTCVFLMLVRLDVGILGLPLLLVRNSR